MNRKRLSYKWLPGSGGFTLLEALIALLVLSLGMLGLAFLQVNALQSAQFSYQTTIANMIAKDVKERLWIELAVPSSAVPEDFFDCDYVDISYGSSVLSEIKDDWGANENSHYPEKLSGLDVSIFSQGACGYLVEVSWLDKRMNLGVSDDDGRSVLSYYVKLPGEYVVPSEE